MFDIVQASNFTANQRAACRNAYEENGNCNRSEDTFLRAGMMRSVAYENAYDSLRRKKSIKMRSKDVVLGAIPLTYTIETTSTQMLEIIRVLFTRMVKDGFPTTLL